MNRKIVVISILFIFILCGHMYAQQISMNDTLHNKIISDTVLPYCRALKDGDVSAIKQHIAGDMYKKYKVLLEQNTEYPEYLRKYYQGVQFQVIKAEDLADNVKVDLEITYPDGRINTGKLILWKENQEIYETGNWKIIEFNM